MKIVYFYIYFFHLLLLLHHHFVFLAKTVRTTFARCFCNVNCKRRRCVRAWETESTRLSERDANKMNRSLLSFLIFNFCWCCYCYCFWRCPLHLQFWADARFEQSKKSISITQQNQMILKMKWFQIEKSMKATKKMAKWIWP